MSSKATNTETVLLPDLIPLALIAVEVGDSVDRIAHRFGEAVVVLDDVGLRSVPADAARRFFTERAEWKARQVEEQRRRTEELAQKKKKAPVAVPGLEGKTAVESMILQDANFKTPHDEFTGRERPTFLEDALDQSAREIARRRADRAEKKRLADEMRKNLQ